MTDPIADFLTRIRNAQQREKQELQVPATKMIVAITEILKKEGFIKDYQLVDTEPQKTLSVELKYVNGVAAIRDLKRVSKPGVRRYVGYKDIPHVMRGLGVAILSTPKGIMTGKQARVEKTGGEFICTVY
ncbi:MAG: 30S ribosomal protein S8 [Candidatus Doudnabacteria bacterium]|nr:30S ribosomal protein S8 [Candidatus Doudnabacteria bacterium]